MFVTVGTTQFDKLVTAATSSQALQWMEDQGYTQLIIQYGRGVQPKIEQQHRHHTSDDKPSATSPTSSSLHIRTYDFLPSLQNDMEQADLVLSHAGAGTVMESLRMRKKLVVVINTLLMDNHQTELAGAMAQRGHLFMVEQPELLDNMDTWSSFQDFTSVAYQDGDASNFSQTLDYFLGFTKAE